MTPTEETVIVTLQLLKHSQQTAFTDGYVLAMTQAVNVLENEISRVEKEHDMTESKGYRYDLDIRQETLLDMVEAIKKQGSNVMELFLSFVLAMVAVAILTGVTIDYFVNRHPRAKQPRRSRLTYEQFEEMKTWGPRVESD